MPSDVLIASVTAGSKLSEVLVAEKIVVSKSEFRRLVEGKGVSEFGSDNPIIDPEYTIDRPISLRIGKRRFIKINLQ